MILPKDILSQSYTKPRLFLCETDKTKICQLETVDMSGTFRFNSYSELEFTVGRTYEDIISGEQKINPHYNKIEALRLVYLDGFGYFEIQDPEVISDGIREVKSVTAYSLEYNLSQKYLNDFIVNTGEIGSVEVTYANGGLIRPVVLYDPLVPQLSLLHLALEKVYGWAIGHVDPSLKNMTRTFDVSRASVYDFLTQDVCDKFNCYFVFNTVENTINVYAESLINNRLRGDGNTKSFIVSPAYESISSVSIDGYKTTAYTYNYLTGELVFDEAPGSGAKIEVVDGSQAQWITDIYVTFDNLAQEVNIDYSADDIKTVLTVKGADDLDIREVNFGLPYITDLSYYYTVDWMGQELYDAYTVYLEKCDRYQNEYTENTQKILETNNQIWYATNRLTLLYEKADVNSTVVGTYYIRGGTEPNYYYTEVQLPAEYNANATYYTLQKNGLNETKFSNFYAAIQTYYNSKTSKTVSDIETLKEDFSFVTTYTVQNLVSDLKAASNTSAKDAAITKFINQLWEHLGLYPLEKLYYEPYKLIQETNIEAGWDKTSNSNYWLYYPVTVVLASLEKAKVARQQEIEGLKYIIRHENEDGTESGIEVDNQNISSELLLDNNFTSKQLIRLSAFLREDEYTDDNFIETDSDTIDTIMKTKQELLECGRIELSKLCEPKLQFSMDMANIYALHEFEPIIHQFQLGKIVNIKLREAQTSTLQLVGDGEKNEFIVPILFDEVKTISDDTIKIHEYNSQTGKLVFNKPLEKNACVEVTLVKYYVKQSRLLEVNINFDDFSDFSCEFGDLTNLRTPSSIHADLLAGALIAGKSVASNASYWNKGTDLATSTDLKIQQGLLGAIDGLYSSDQSIIINESGILLRKVNEDGSFSPYQAWLTSNNILLSDDGFAQGSIPRMGLGEFTVDGETFYGVLAEAVLSGYIEGSRIVGGTINIGDGTFLVDEFGNVTMKASSIEGYVEEDGVISSINQSPESITINADRISLVGKTIDLTSDNISIASTNFSVTEDGHITATSGEIAGWTIYPGLFRKDTTVDGVDYQIYMQSTDGVSTSNAFVIRKRNSGETDWDYQFRVNYEGKLTAKNANITGTITAEDGSIAGYNIGPGGSYDNALYKRVSGDSADYEVGMKATSGDTDLAFYVKESDDSWESSSNTFYIRNNGQLYAKKADITGKITASSGTVGSWTIGDMGNYTDSIYSTYCAASTPSSSNPEYAVFMRGKGEETTIAIGVKNRTSSSTAWTDAETPFYVRKDGYVKMANANVTGTINSSSGSIGGFDISEKYLRSDITKSGTRYQTFMQAADGTDTTTAFGVRTSTDGGDTWTYQFRVNYDGSATLRNATITGSSTIASACIPNLNANKITAGTLDVDRIPNISASKITSGTISTDRLSSSVITTSNFSSKSLTTGSLTVTGGGTIGSWSVTSAGALTAVSGDVGVGLSAYGLSAGSGGSTSWVSILMAGQNASDERLKKNVSEFDNKLDNIFDSLRPVQFEYSTYTLSQGIHFGYLAQDVVKSFEDVGEKIEDYSFVYETATENDSTEKYYQLNKAEFIALNTWQIQKLKTRVEELENRLAALEA